MHAEMHMHDFIYIHACIFIMHAFIHACMNTHPDMHASIPSIHACMLLHKHSIPTHVYIHTCMHIHISHFFHWIRKGVSADADPHYQKLYGRVTDVCSNRKSQPSPGAMKWPRLGRYPSLIRYAPPSGKYASSNCHRWQNLNSFT